MISESLKPYLALIPMFVIFPLGAALILKLWRKNPFLPLALWNVVVTFCLVFATVLGELPEGPLPWRGWGVASVVPFGTYLLSVFGCWIALRGALAKRIPMWTAYLAPIALLICVKYVPGFETVLGPRLLESMPTTVLFFVGISYVTLRLTHLTMEAANEVVPPPSLAEYFAFAFFVPLHTLGPLSPYSRFRSSILRTRPFEGTWARAITRISKGLVKYVLFSAIFSQLTYAGLLLDGHPHLPVDLFIAILVYPLYLYANFSGFCDIVIGVCGLLRIDIAENFDRPFVSRNFQEFWTRWHITLSQWLRDIVFTPLVKELARKFGQRFMPHAVALAILTTFLLIGLWHGATLNFLLFGLSQGVGVVFVHYSSTWLKKRLGKAGFATYRERRDIATMGRIATYSYFAITLFLFANDEEAVRRIISAVRF